MRWSLALLIALLAGCAGSSDPCRVHPEQCEGDIRQPTDDSSAPDSTGSDSLLAPDALGVDAGPGADLGPCGDCDDKDPCTVDSCVAGTCEHEPVIPSSCGNGALDACEVCDGTEPLGADQECVGCVNIGKAYDMYNKTDIWDVTAFFEVDCKGSEWQLQVTCKGSRVVKKLVGYCEHSGNLYCKAGALGTPTCTIACDNQAGNGTHNESRFGFLCGLP